MSKKLNDSFQDLETRKKISIYRDIPRHLLTTDDAEILKKVVLHSVATAFASIVCNIKIKFLYCLVSMKKLRLKCIWIVTNNFPFLNNFFSHVTRWKRPVTWTSLKLNIAHQLILARPIQRNILAPMVTVDNVLKNLHCSRHSITWNIILKHTT